MHFKAFKNFLDLEKGLAEQFSGKSFPLIELGKTPSIQIDKFVAEDALSTFELMRAA